MRVVSQSGDLFAGFNNVTLPPVEQLQAAIAAARRSPRAPARTPARAPSAPAPTRGLAGALAGR